MDGLMTMLHGAISCAIVLVLSASALPALGQDGNAGGDGGAARIVVLKFNTSKVDPEVMDSFYRSLNEAIEAHPGMQVAAGGDLSIDDLILTLGCESASAQCLSGRGEFVEGDRLAFGSVQRSGQTYRFDLKMFDFREDTFVRQVIDQTIEGNPKEVKRAAAAICDGFIYGDVGRLEVAIDSDSEAEVFIDGQAVGTTPLTAANLPLGQHTVTVHTSDGPEQSKRVLVGRTRSSTIRFDLPSGGQDRSASGPDRRLVAGWAATGVGAIGLAAGIVSSFQLSTYNTEATTLVCGDVLCESAAGRRAGKLQEDMNSAYTVSVIGYSVAAVGLAAGGYFLYEAYHDGEVDPTSDDSSDGGATMQVHVGPTPGGAAGGVRISF